jgi:hypothetical protein
MNLQHFSQPQSPRPLQMVRRILATAVRRTVKVCSKIGAHVLTTSRNAARAGYGQISFFRVGPAPPFLRQALHARYLRISD